MRRGLARKLAEMRARLDSLFKAYVDRLRSAYPHSVIVLFGSRARGDHLPYSDYDIAIILPGPLDVVGETVRARMLKPPALPADVLVLPLESLEDPITVRMLRGCVVLHDGLGLKLILQKLGCRAGQSRNEK